ncbi:MAG: hypothetical protein J6B37_02685 [Clostridia bacterium]|nr:hypothetical protein [Clostridia bacterium]
MALCDKNALTDLRDITIDKSKSVMERIENFTGQVKNPYLFKVGDVIVKVAYSGGKDFSGALSSALCSC